MSEPGGRSSAVESTNQAIASVAQKVHDAAAKQARRHRPDAGETAHSTLVVTGTGDIVSRTEQSSDGERETKISNQNGT